MKYVVSGYIGFNNFGDEAIARTLIQKLQKENAEKITYISSNPEETKKQHGVDACSMLGFFRPLKEADVLISGGGSLLQDVTSFKSLIYYLIIIYTALFLKKKVIIYAQGIGPIKSKTGQILTKFALKKASEVSVRDTKSLALLKNWNIDADLVKDPVLELDLPHKNKKGTVGIQLRNFAGVTEEFLNNLASTVVKYLPNKKYKLLSLQDSVDLVLCKKFADKLNALGINDAEVIHNNGINEVIEEISNLEYLISMRFHANIIGIKSGIKVLAINYDPKITALAEEYGLPLINLYDKNFTEAFEELVK
jgi:polysaccharide pyruvyl transferase CsaB